MEKRAKMLKKSKKVEKEEKVENEQQCWKNSENVQQKYWNGI